jgi:competence protein ComEC
MPLYLVLFSLSVLSVGLLPELPPLKWCVIFLLLFFSFCLISLRPSFSQFASSLRITSYRFPRILVTIGFGLTAGIFFGHQFLSQQLSSSDSGREYILRGTVSGLPKQESRQLRFLVDVESLTAVDGRQIQHIPRKVQLSWYISRYQTPPELQPGDYREWRVKLHRPRSMVNPAGFDYQVWLMRRGVGATGYVLKGNNRELPAAALTNLGHWIDQQRYHLQRWIVNNSQSTHKGILIALLIGDSALVEKNDWLTMQQTGTNHLIAISGLHVGFLAIFGFYVGLFFGRLMQLFSVRWPAQYFAYIGAISFAAFYSALAGFNIPTLRTLLMISLFYWICLSRRETRVIDIFCLSLTCVVIIDPLAGYDIGFWLSFGAVALLILCFSGRKKLKQERAANLTSQIQNNIMIYVKSQWVMFAGLMIPLLILISSFSLAAPVANALAIPLITFFVVPCLLLAALLESLTPMISEFLLFTAGWGIEQLLAFLKALLDFAPGKLNPVISLSTVSSIWLAFCCLMVLLPRGFFSRLCCGSAVLLFLMVHYFLPKPDQPDLKMLVLDVGQGTSVVIQVKDKILVYDTGAAFSDNFDAGSGIIAPYLRSDGITRLDKLIVSHNDQDHAGGLKGLMDSIAVEQLLLGQYLPQFPPSEQQRLIYSNTNDVKSCHEFPKWQWGKVNFEFIQWPLRKRASANNYSCVLLVDYEGKKILLPGDLEKEIESQLLTAEKLPPNIDVLLAGHHGSLSSSTPEFVNYLHPKQVVYSAGFENRYGHPHAKVRDRFQSIGSEEFNTATQGALEFRWNQAKQLPVLSYREAYKRYWF